MKGSRSFLTHPSSLIPHPFEVGPRVDQGPRGTRSEQRTKDKGQRTPMYPSVRQSKPWPGVGIDVSHPLAQGLAFAVPFNEHSGAPYEVVNSLKPSSTANMGWGSAIDGSVATFNGTSSQLVYPAPVLFTKAVTVLCRCSLNSLSREPNPCRAGELRIELGPPRPVEHAFLARCGRRAARRLELLGDQYRNLAHFLRHGQRPADRQ